MPDHAARTWRGPRCRGPLFSRPISRILSCAAIYLCAPPGSRRAGSSILLGLAPDGVWPAAASPRRWCALTAPFHPCLYAQHVHGRHRRSVSVPLSRGFPRVGVTDRPCPSVSGLSSRVTSRDCVACSSDSTPRIKPPDRAGRSAARPIPRGTARQSGAHPPGPARPARVESGHARQTEASRRREAHAERDRRR